MKATMRTLTILAVVAICVGQLSLVNTENSPEKLCSKERRRALVAIKKRMDKCQSSMPNASKHPGCIVKCVLEQENALESDSSITKESFMEAVNKRTTGEQREKALSIFDDCMKEYGEAIVVDDETCPGYLNLGLCLRTGIEDLCDETTGSDKTASDPGKEKVQGKEPNVEL